MELKGKRVSIRSMQPSDAAAYLALTQDPAVAVPAGMSELADLHAAEQHLASTRDTEFAVTRDGQLIGEVGVYPRTQDPDDPAWTTRELGYALNQRDWGHGLMKEALTLVLDELFARDITAVWAGVYPDNRRSIALLAHLGFEYRFTAALPAGLAQGGSAEAYFERVNENYFTD
ncbi:GNAT family N-acetyltransferase [Lacticaseibacillus hegangensis]|uniref:GNAT family N-acetyltransferase n=1 Tax=Lacticaseibacillus hegangensis TaxID=2486010 RepID=A0ABW4CSK2_9LACO|nr:GNAT family N-acetyltransferase [Lacticaseibacillus hegangensis]